MDNEKRFELYERLYFEGLEARDRIANRLQVPMVLLLSTASVCALIIKGLSFHQITIWHIAVATSMTLALVAFVISAIFFTKALTGHTYNYMPTSLDNEKYWQTLEATYKEYENCNTLVSQHFYEYLRTYFNKCDHVNTTVNEARAYYLYVCNKYLIVSAVPLVISFLIFTLAGIDKDSYQKINEERGSNRVTIVSNDEPPVVTANVAVSNIELESSLNVKEISNDRASTTEEPATTTTTPHQGQP